MPDGNDIREFADEIRGLNARVRETVNELEQINIFPGSNIEIILGLEKRAFNEIKNLMMTVNSLLAFLGHDDKIPEFDGRNIPQPAFEFFEEPLLPGEVSLEEFQSRKQMRRENFEARRDAAIKQFASENGMTEQEVREDRENKIVFTPIQRPNGELDMEITWR